MGLGRLYGLFVRLDQAIDYEAIDGRPVDLVFLLLIPANAKSYLQALASISRRLRDRNVAARLRSTQSAGEAYQALATV